MFLIMFTLASIRYQIIKTTNVSVIDKKDVKPDFDITERSLEASIKRLNEISVLIKNIYLIRI